MFLLVQTWWKIEVLIARLRFYLSFKQKKFLYIKKEQSLLDGDFLELGGGETPRLKALNFKNVDIRNLKEVDIVASTLELDKADFPNGVCYIYSRHMIEHLAGYEVPLLFENWRKIIRDTAVIEIIVPNIRYHCLQYLASRHDTKGYTHSMAGFNGWQRCEGENYWDVHKSSFDRKSLMLALKQKFDVEDYTFVTRSMKHLHLIAKIKNLS